MLQISLLLERKQKAVNKVSMYSSFIVTYIIHDSLLIRCIVNHKQVTFLKTSRWRKISRNVKQIAYSVLSIYKFRNWFCWIAIYDSKICNAMFISRRDNYYADRKHKIDRRLQRMNEWRLFKFFGYIARNTFVRLFPSVMGWKFLSNVKNVHKVAGSWNVHQSLSS